MRSILCGGQRGPTGGNTGGNGGQRQYRLRFGELKAGFYFASLNFERYFLACELIVSSVLSGSEEIETFILVICTTPHITMPITIRIIKFFI